MRTLRIVGALLALILVVMGCTKPAPEPTATAIAAATATPEAAEQPPTLVPTTTPEPADEDEAYPLPAPEQASQPTSDYPEPPQEPEQGAAMPRIDGTIDPVEYRHEKLVDDFVLRWSNDSEHLYVAMQGLTTGWISVGFDPENRMQGANYVVGAVIDGEAVIWDAFGMAPVGPNHPEDTELGGTTDVIAYAGAERDGLTLIEFQIPLDSGDAYDKALTVGETYTVLVALGSGDAFTAAHTWRAATEITLDAVE